MSKFSGKCDLYDHIAGLGGWYDKDGNQVKFGQNGVNCYYSDEFQDFEAFKKATGGVIYQTHHINKVTKYNQYFIEEHNINFRVIKHHKQIADKRKKSGFREKISYTYSFFDKEYTAQELNKQGGVYITTEIHFDEITDIIKYYPYTITMSYGDKNGKSIVYISRESFVDREHKESMQYGYLSEMKKVYDKELADHYKEVICRYYIPKEKKIYLE